MKIDSYDNVLRWSYKLAKDWVQENLVPKGVNSSRKFDTYKRSGEYLPKNFPRKPDEYFKKKEVWKGWPDFLGKPAEFSDKFYLKYNEASSLCQKMGIKNSIEYRTWTNRPANLPARPDQFYKSVWSGWQNFLGKNYDIPDRKVVSKLKPADVRIIKHQLDLGVPGAVLARTFGVSEMQISRIKNGENWSKV
ncbi:MAG: hypothetical protein JW894_07865 [Bacteroidales bacterium]|nr:hypothetical protein [Bacteroidales bacterium]